MKKTIALLIILVLVLSGCYLNDADNNETVVGSVNETPLSLDDYCEILDKSLNFVYSTYKEGNVTIDEFFENANVEDTPAFEFAKEYAYKTLIDIEVCAQLANEYGIFYETLGSEGDDYNKGNTTVEKKMLAQDELFKFFKSGPAAPCYVKSSEVKDFKETNPEFFKKPQTNYILYREIYIGKQNALGEKYSYEQIKNNRASIAKAYEELSSGADFYEVWGKYDEEKVNSKDVFDGHRLYTDSTYGTRAEIIKSLPQNGFSKVYETDSGYSIYYIEDIVEKTDAEIEESVKEMLEQNKFKDLIQELKKDFDITKKTNVIKSIKYNN